MLLQPCFYLVKLKTPNNARWIYVWQACNKKSHNIKTFKRLKRFLVFNIVFLRNLIYNEHNKIQLLTVLIVNKAKPWSEVYEMWNRQSCVCPYPQYPPKSSAYISLIHRAPLLMKVSGHMFAPSSFSTIVQYTMDALPPKIMQTQQANLRRETPQVWINTPDFHETKTETFYSQTPLCHYWWIPQESQNSVPVFPCF